MFYTTTIKSVGNTGVIDAQGRRLNFIGYLPVKEGDTVYTDGRFIFGNAPPKGSPAIFDEPSGIPVLGDEYSLSDSDPKDELRGYFTTNGKYKKYRIAGDDWITNDKKTYAHDGSFEDVDDENIIDAEVIDGDDFIIKKGVYKKGEKYSLNYSMLPIIDKCVFYFNPPYSAVTRYGKLTSPIGSENFQNEQIPVKVLKNNSKETEIDLEIFAKDIEERALLCAEAIMKKSYVSPDNTPSYFPEFLIQQEISPTIVYTTAHVQTINVTESEHESGTVFAVSYGYCSPEIEPRIIIKAPSNGVTRRLGERKLVLFGCSCLYKFSTEHIENFEVINFHDFGGLDTDILSYGARATEINMKLDINSFWDGHYNRNVRVSSLPEVVHLELKSRLMEIDRRNEVFLPVGNGFYQMDKFGRLTFFDSKKTKVAENIPVNDNFFYFEFGAGKFMTEFYCPLVFNKPSMIDYKIYTPDGNVEEKTLLLVDSSILHGRINSAPYMPDGIHHNYNNDITYYDEAISPPVDGYYVEQDNGSLEPLNFTPLFHQFKNGYCLCGVRGGKLYLVTKDGIEIVGDGVKNFRLRELKKISKAKK